MLRKVPVFCFVSLQRESGEKRMTEYNKNKAIAFVSLKLIP